MEYKGWITDNNIVKRSLAIFGHYTLAMLAIYGFFMVIFMIGAFFVGFYEGVMGL